LPSVRTVGEPLPTAIALKNTKFRSSVSTRLGVSVPREIPIGTFPEMVLPTRFASTPVQGDVHARTTPPPKFPLIIVRSTTRPIDEVVLWALTPMKLFDSTLSLTPTVDGASAATAAKAPSTWVRESDAT